MTSTPTVAFVCLVNRHDEYDATRRTLEPQFSSGDLECIPVRADERKWNAAVGLNHGIDASSADWIVCAHQDVRFPSSWWERASAQLRSWRGTVGIAGLVGVQRSGRFVGHVVDPHGHCRWRPLPARVCSVDEHVIIIRRDSGLRFDPENPHFHCYGTDIALTAARDGQDAIVIDAPVLHLSGGKLDDRFGVASEWLLEKWGGSMNDVIPTCAAVIARQRHRNSLRRLRVRLTRRQSRTRRHCDCEFDVSELVDES